MSNVWGDVMTKLTFVAILTTVLFASCQMINRKLGLEDDNIFEQGVEAFIDHQTGFEIDLTP